MISCRISVKLVVVILHQRKLLSWDFTGLFDWTWNNCKSEWNRKYNENIITVDGKPQWTGVVLYMRSYPTANNCANSFSEIKFLEDLGKLLGISEWLSGKQSGIRGKIGIKDTLKISLCDYYVSKRSFKGYCVARLLTSAKNEILKSVMYSFMDSCIDSGNCNMQGIIGLRNPQTYKCHGLICYSTF